MVVQLFCFDRRRGHVVFATDDQRRHLDSTQPVDDIVAFANLSGDRFYAHMDDDEARTNGVFTGRVATRNIMPS